jgi:glyoxylase-like metal-dependent hydrolase (beta-lactamase superfamily II)
MLDFIKPLPDDLKDFLLIMGEEVGDYYTCNSLLIGNTLIDTGFSTNYLKAVLDNYKIEQVIFTHWHEDHISGSSLVKNCKFACHPRDTTIIEDISKMVELYGYNTPPKELKDYLNKYDLSNTQISETINDNDIIKVGNDISLKLIHTPGHAAGHCCFYEESLKFAHLSDISMPDSGPWYGGLDSSLIEYENSLEKLLKLQIKTAIMSHVGLIEEYKDIVQIINQQKTYIKERDELILSKLSEKRPTVSDDLWKKGLIFNGDAGYEGPLMISEKIMIEKHFENF